MLLHSLKLGWNVVIRKAAAFMDDAESTSSTSRQNVNQPMDQNDIDPGDKLHKDLQDMSINQDQLDPDNPEDEVSYPSSRDSSSDSLSSLPHTSGSENDNANKTAIFIAGSKQGGPKTSTPKGTKKTSKAKGTKPKSLTGIINKRSEKASASPRIDSFLINTSQNKKTTDVSAPVVPNVLDWYDAVDNPTSHKEKLVSAKPEESRPFGPLPQRDSNKSTKRKRIGTDGTCIITDQSHNNVSTDISNDVINVNNPSDKITEGSRSTSDMAIETRVAWLIGDYPSTGPLPESLIGKKVRFEPEPTVQNNDPDRYSQNNKQPVTNPTSDSLQDGNADPLNLSEDAAPFFKRARGCLSAASRADARATHIDLLVARGVAAPWALRLEPAPAYLMPFAHELTDRQRQNALKLMSEASASLRKSCSNLVKQGNNNWNIVSKCIDTDDAELNRVRLKMDSLVARDFDREKVRLDARNATLIANPVTNKTIVDNLRIRGYVNPNKTQRTRSPPRRDNAPVDKRAQEADPNQGNNAGARPKDAGPYNPPPMGRGKRRRSNSRSRSRSPNRGRGRYGQSFRGRGRGGMSYSNFRRQPQNNLDMVDPDVMAAIVKKVAQEMNQPTYQNQPNYQRGSRDNYRY